MKPAGYDIPPFIIASIAATLLFAWIILSIPGRAFDMGDPGGQVAGAVQSVQALKTQGPFAWLRSVTSDTASKPGLNAALSIGMLLGAGQNHFGYIKVLALIIALTVGVTALSAWKLGGLRGLAAALSLFALSNLFLAYSQYGGHCWLGMLFFGSALLMQLHFDWLKDSALRCALFSFLQSLSFYSSPHMAPFIFILSCFWLFRMGKARAFTAKRLAAFALGAGLIAILLFGTGLYQEYWAAFRQNFILHERVDPQFTHDKTHFIRFFTLNESAAFIGVLLLSLAAGVYALLKEKKSEIPVMIAVCFLIYVFSGLMKIGRVYVPILPLLFLVSSTGMAREGFKFLWIAGALAAVAFFQTPILHQTWQAFHAGKALQKIVGDEKIFVIGSGIPYAYLPGKEIRVKFSADVRAGAPSGNEWILVSRMSNWHYDRFEGDLDPKEIYGGGKPFIPVPGVESLPFQLFTNERIYFKTADGEIEFPLQNRLYRVSDVLNPHAS